METVLVVLGILPSLVFSLIMPMTNLSGVPDMNSIISHVTLMEQTITTLQAQVQTTTAQMASMNTKLQTTESELASVKSDLRSAETEIAVLKHDLQKSSDPTEFANVKSELATLKLSYDSLKSNINSTAIESDVKTNSREINYIKHQMSQSISFSDLISNDVKKNGMEINNIKAELNSVKSQQNASKELSSTKALALSQVKTIQSQVNNISEVVTSMLQDLSSVSSSTDMNAADVAFQVTQSTTLVPGSTTLKFDTVSYNHGCGYDNETGLFSAPIAGTYIFWANVEFHSISTRSNYVYIIQGQTKLATGYTNTIPSAGILFSVASALTVTHLNISEQVHFSTGTTDNSIIGIGESRYGGALLRASTKSF